jgi:hypothetical protein
MKLFELNLWHVQISFQLETRQSRKKWLEFITNEFIQNGWNSTQDTVNNTFAIFNHNPGKN